MSFFFMLNNSSRIDNKKVFERLILQKVYQNIAFFEHLWNNNGGLARFGQHYLFAQPMKDRGSAQETFFCNSVWWQ